MREEIAQLRELCRLATPGPWRAGRSDMVSYLGQEAHGPCKFIYPLDDVGDEQERLQGVAKGWGRNCVNNANFIAAACNAIPRLLDELELLERIVTTDGVRQKCYICDAFVCNEFCSAQKNPRGQL